MDFLITVATVMGITFLILFLAYVKTLREKDQDDEAK
ncbi:hypothetical protein X953_06330 [Virgibacillus sp. SK37]|nr:hypothetical protein X953_06330 [Virgibacillus sp. SK37]